MNNNTASIVIVLKPYQGAGGEVGGIRDWVIAFDVTLYSPRVLQVKTFAKTKEKRKM